jgi:hypothetical protein
VSRSLPRVPLASVAFASLVGCAAIAGVDKYRADECFGGACASDGGGSADALDEDPTTSVDAQAPVEAGPVSAGQSTVTVSGTGVAVGATAIATLTTRDANGLRVTSGGAQVTFTATGGTSTFEVGAVVDVGDGTYRATFKGLTEGTSATIGGTIDGAAVTTPLPTLRVVEPIRSGLTFSLDAADADGAKGFGGAGCAGAGLATWKDLSVGGGGRTGALDAFSTPPCATGSGWAGDGTPENPHRLSFDGIDDAVSFGAINSLDKQTVIVWARRTGQGTAPHRHRRHPEHLPAHHEGDRRGRDGRGRHQLLPRVDAGRARGHGLRAEHRADQRQQSPHRQQHAARRHLVRDRHDLRLRREQPRALRQREVGRNLGDDRASVGGEHVALGRRWLQSH